MSSFRVSSLGSVVERLGAAAELAAELTAEADGCLYSKVRARIMLRSWVGC
jgi:hypothetical protein